MKNLLIDLFDSLPTNPKRESLKIFDVQPYSNATMICRTFLIRRLGGRYLHRYITHQPRSNLFPLSTWSRLSKEQELLHRSRRLSTHEALSTLTEAASVEDMEEDREPNIMKNGEDVIEDDYDDTFTAKFDDDEKDKIMQDIHKITYETIQDVLATDPHLRKSWEKALKRMEIAQRIPMKNYTEETDSIEYGSFKEPTGSLVDLLDDPTEISKPPSEFLKEDINLMDLLDDFDDDQNIPQSTTHSFDIFEDKGSRDDDLLSITNIKKEDAKESTQQLLDIDKDSLSITNDTIDNNDLSNLLDDDESIDEMNLFEVSGQDMKPSSGSTNNEFAEISQISESGSESRKNDLNEATGETLMEDPRNDFVMDYRNADDSHMDAYSYQKIMSDGLALITSLNDDQWHNLYNNHDESTTDDENEGALDTSSSGGTPLSESNILTTSDVSGQNDTLSKMESILKSALANHLSLCTEEYNVILMKLASTSAYQIDDTISMMLEIYDHMMDHQERCCPDGYTYAILIPTLTRKGQVPSTAVNIVLDMMRDDFTWDNPEALIQALQCLERSKKISEAETLIRKVMQCTGERITIPVQAIIPLMRLYRSERMMDEAMDLLDDFIEESGYGFFLNDVFKTIISWPRQNKKGQHGDIQVLHTFLFSRLKRFEQQEDHNHQRGRPLNKTWRHFVLQLKKYTPITGKSTETHLIHEIFWLLFNRDSQYWPDETLLKCGLEIAARQGDSNLSIEILRRRLAKPQEHSRDPSKHGFGKKAAKGDPFPPQALVIAMQTCIACNDVIGLKKILPIIDHPDLDLPELIKRKLINQAIRGFVEAGDYLEGRKALTLMADRKLVPSDEALGAVIHGLAIHGKEHEALEMFEETKAGTFGDFRPGICCYNGKILSLLQLKSWEEVILLQEEMEEAMVTPNAVAFQGILLASMRMGDESSVVQAVEQGIKSNITLDRDCFEQSIKCLLPELLASEHPTVPEIRLQLRQQVDIERNTSIGNAYLSLSRALRVAEIEDERGESKNVLQEEISLRRQNAWKIVHTELLKLYRLLDEEYK